MAFSERLVTARKQTGLTQAGLARLAGISNTSVCKFETGERKPSLQSFRAMAVALRVSADYLLDIDIKKLWGTG
ncbi:MAG: helix-turn-helix domain-containing protein [Treponema sp.]|jgi:transcriptional regulator with XRE-family HTH domain|nr:helix-turn-helix domain-containing protein [Treponema sp.]